MYNPRGSSASTNWRNSSGVKEAHLARGLEQPEPRQHLVNRLGHVSTSSQ